MERDQYKELGPVAVAAVLAGMSAQQETIDTLETEIKDLKAKVKGKEADIERVHAHWKEILHARRDGKPLFLLLDGRLTAEAPDEPTLFENGEVAPAAPKLVDPADTIAPNEETSLVIPAPVLDALGSYRSGRVPLDIRKQAAGILVGHLVGGGALPKGYDRDEVKRAAKTVLKAKDLGEADVARETPPPATVAVPAGEPKTCQVAVDCVSTVNLIPLDSVDAVVEDCVLAASTGELMRVKAIKPRRREISVERGFRGTKAMKLDAGVTLRVVDGPASPAARPESIPAPEPVAAPAAPVAATAEDL